MKRKTKLVLIIIVGFILMIQMLGYFLIQGKAPERKEVVNMELPKSPIQIFPEEQDTDNKENKSPEIGRILYNPPKEMTINKTERIEVRISSKSVDTSNLHGKGEIQIEAIKTSALMRVRMQDSGSAFDIIAINEEVQMVTDNDFTQWTFDVAAKKRGTHNLNLVVSAIYYNKNNRETTKAFPVMTRKIEIGIGEKSSLVYWVESNLVVFVTAVLIFLSLITILIIKYKKKNKITNNYNIFISYRRDDSSGYTLAVYDKLKQYFGEEKIFMDRDGIPHGVDFISHIENVLSEVQIMLVVIGSQWVNSKKNNMKRLNDPEDFVRLEISAALKRKIIVIPVLLKNTQMPSSHELPEVIKDLARRNAIQIHDDQFDSSINSLITTIEKVANHTS